MLAPPSLYFGLPFRHPRACMLASQPVGAQLYAEPPKTASRQLTAHQTHPRCPPPATQHAHLIRTEISRESSLLPISHGLKRMGFKAHALCPILVFDTTPRFTLLH